MAERMGFRRRLSIFLVVALATVQLLTAAAVYFVTRTVLIGEGKAQLAVAAGQFKRQLDALGDQVAGSVEVLARDFALRQAIAQRDRGTVLSALRNHGRRVGAARMLLIGLDGTVDADTTNPDEAGARFPFAGMLDEASGDNYAASVVAVEGKVYWLVLVPVLAPEAIAYIAAGIPIDDRFLTRLQDLGSLPKAISLVTDAGGDGKWRPVAGNAAAGLLARLPPPGAPLATEPALVSTDRQEMLMLAARLDTPPGSGPVLAVVGYSLDDALRPYRPVLVAFAILLAASLAAALAGAVLIARGVARPLEGLAAVARRIEVGDYSPPPPPVQKDEIGQLNAALGKMAQAIGEREERIRVAAAEAERAAVLEVEIRTLARLGEVGQEITGTLDAESVLATLRRHLADLLDAPVLAVWLLDRDGAALTLGYGIDCGAPMPVTARDRIPLGDPESPVAAAARDRRQLLADRPGGEGGALFGPLLAGDRLLGVLSVQSARPGAYGQREQLVFRSLCAYGAVALSNAEAYRDLDQTLATLRETMEERQRLKVAEEQDLAFARELQIGTLPPSGRFHGGEGGGLVVEIVARMNALREVGGDFYDFVMLDDRRLLLAVGDASGKGIAAAMFASMARSSLRAESRQTGSPAVLLADVNDFLALNNPALMFVTVLLGILDIDAGTLTYASAGHPFALLVRPGRGGGSGEVARLTEAQGMALGVVEAQHYAEAEHGLHPGDTLVFYSDGISEAENESGEMYGEARLAATLHRFADRSPDEIVNAVLDDIRDFSGTRPPGDDTTLLVLRLDEAGGGGGDDD
jgi:serine phosphatase RsbU (regulator of sigma subunit)/HAMP domain-containing protein